jgi:hypothetical protein
MTIGGKMAKGKLLMVPDIAERLRRSEQSVRWMIHTGELAPTAKIGRRRVMAEEDLEQWISTQFEKAAV